MRIGRNEGCTFRAECVYYDLARSCLSRSEHLLAPLGKSEPKPHHPPRARWRVDLKPLQKAPCQMAAQCPCQRNRLFSPYGHIIMAGLMDRSHHQLLCITKLVHTNASFRSFNPFSGFPSDTNAFKHMYENSCVCGGGRGRKEVYFQVRLHDVLRESEDTEGGYFPHPPSKPSSIIYLVKQ